MTMVVNNTLWTLYLESDFAPMNMETTCTNMEKIKFDSIRMNAFFSGLFRTNFEIKGNKVMLNTLVYFNKDKQILKKGSDKYHIEEIITFENNKQLNSKNKYTLDCFENKWLIESLKQQ